MECLSFAWIIVPGFVAFIQPETVGWRVFAINGEYRHLGCFATKAEASAVYESSGAGLRELHGEFYRRQK